ncbi:MAG: SLATT domain-containing protein, partial [Sphingobacteriales bacterium]
HTQKPLYNLIMYRPIDRCDSVLATKKLTELYNETLRLADDKIDWYDTFGKKKGYWARVIRSIAIVIFIASTLMPYLSFLYQDHTDVPKSGTGFLYIGYLLAGIGGGMLLFDKYYGYSNSWVRFVLTKMDLTAMRNSFVQNWQVVLFNYQPLSPEGFARMIEVILNFQTGFHNTVRAETEAWAKEFQQSLHELMSALKTQSDSTKSDIEKQKNESADWKAKSLATHDIAELPAKQQMDVIRQAVIANREHWKNSIKNYTGASIAKKVQGAALEVINPGTYCIQFNVIQKEDIESNISSSVPEFIYWHGYRIPTDVLETGLITSSIFTGENLPEPKPLGCSIGRENILSSGTLGLRIKLNDGKLYGLSCYHVLFPNELKKRIYEIKKDENDKLLPPLHITSPSNEDGKKLSYIGKVSHGRIDEFLDCGFFETSAERISKQIH